MTLCRLILSLMLAGLATGPARGDGGLELRQVTADVYAIVGELGNRSPGNFGNNATFGFVVTGDGVVLIDPGGTRRGAREIDRLIKSVTELPVVVVINTGGQDHRWLGNGYFKQAGARIVASERAVKDQRARARDQLIALGNLVGEQFVAETSEVYADETFTEAHEFVVGGTRFEIRHAGPAHTPGDSFVRLPRENVIFTGDVVYTERMLGVIAQSSSKNWLAVFDVVAAYEPRYLVPGHGEPTDLARARQDTREYLVFLRDAVAEFMHEGGDISDIGSIDQSRYEYLENYDVLAGRNAQQVFVEMEWE